MAFKYKLNEMSKKASAEDAEKELGIPKSKFKVGQVTFSDDGTSQSTITNIDPETGAISWRIKQLPGFEKLYDEVDDFVDVAKRVYQKTKDDKKFREFYEQARKIRNSIRTHLRNEYPDQYKRMTRIGEEEVDEVSMSGAAGAYNTPYAFVRKPLKPKSNKKKKKSKYKMSKPSGLVNYMDYTMEEGKLGDGADLGPGPKAGPDGVNDNAYVKQFKYKLVPKSNGTYVQKGSGLEVKKLF